MIRIFLWKTSTDEIQILIDQLAKEKAFDNVAASTSDQVDDNTPDVDDDDIPF
jgi:hypothetical protein